MAITMGNKKDTRPDKEGVVRLKYEFLSKSELECCDDPERLEKLLDSIEVSFKSQGIRKYFNEDSDEREVILVTVTRGQRSIEFEFGLSLVDTEARNMPMWNHHGVVLRHLNGRIPMRFMKYCKAVSFISPLRFDGSAIQYSLMAETLRVRATMGILYSVLCSMKSDYYIPPIFEDFCGEFGYDVDSRKAHDTWQACLKQQQKIHQVIDADEVDCLPS